MVDDVCTSPQKIEVYAEGDGYALKNKYVEILIDAHGDISSIKLRGNNVEVIEAPSNKLVAYIDLRKMGCMGYQGLFYTSRYRV
ncbi:MAG: hypothetical protein QW775_01420 [Ignisphaera sp.]